MVNPKTSVKKRNYSRHTGLPRADYFSGTTRHENLPHPQFAGPHPGPAFGIEFSDFVINPIPPEITRRTGAPDFGCTVSGGSEKLCLTSNCSIDSSGELGSVSYRYVGMVYATEVRAENATAHSVAESTVNAFA